MKSLEKILLQKTEVKNNDPVVSFSFIDVDANMFRGKVEYFFNFDGSIHPILEKIIDQQKILDWDGELHEYGKIQNKEFSLFRVREGYVDIIYCYTKEFSRLEEWIEDIASIIIK